MDNLTVPAARFLSARGVLFNQQYVAVFCGELFRDGEADHTGADDGYVELVMGHISHPFRPEFLPEKSR